MTRVSSKSSLLNRGDSKYTSSDSYSNRTTTVTYRAFVTTDTTTDLSETPEMAARLSTKMGKVDTLTNPPNPQTSLSDGKRKIDAILVYDSNKPSTARDQFLKNLKAQQLVYEEAPSVFHPGRMYLKVHAPNEVLLKYMKLFGISVKFEQLTVIPDNAAMSKCCETILTDRHPNPGHPDMKRAWRTISREPPTTFTNVERSSLVFFIMRYINFGENEEPYKVGLNHLLLRKDFIAAFPLHDGHWEWSTDGMEPFNDRQLLAKYWANFATWYKEQPLYHIENYFGPETAMYFAWLGFYSKMLLISSIVGLLTFLYGFIHIYFIAGKPIEQACESKEYICPVCRICKPRELNYFCFNFYLAHFSDNPASMVYACFMAFWATFFIEFWKREENTLRLKWNMNRTEQQHYRPEYQAKVHNTRIHPYTQEIELYVPSKEKCAKLTFSILVVIVLLCIVLVTIFAVILYERVMKQIGIKPVYITITSSLITLVAMMHLRWIYGKFAYKLTNWENPRTQLDFDKSYMFKMIVFAIINNYGKMLYVAFFKGKFFTYPGDKKIRKSKFPLSSEVCDPTGCVADIFILLAIIIVCKPLYSNLIEILSPKIRIWYKTMKQRKYNLPIWEEQFELNVTNEFTIMEELEEMVVQFGFVTILAAAFPLAPLCCLINNIFEIKIDSTKLVKYRRRGRAVKSSSMDVWFDTLQAIIYMAVMTNALYIAFTSHFIPEQVYFFNYKSDYSHFHLFTLSKFAVEDNYWPNMNASECLYIGQRYPPGDKNSYEKTFVYYYILSCRLAFALVFMVIVFAGTAILSYAIPDIPKKVQDVMMYNQRTNIRKSIKQNFGPGLTLY